MFRIAIVDSSPTEKWHCNQLLDEVQKVASGTLIDSLDFSAYIESGLVDLRSGGESVSNFDAFVLRGLNEVGLPDFQLETFKLLERHVPLVVNPVDSILLAWDKFRTTWEFANQGLPVPRTIVTQHLAEAEEAVLSLGKTVTKPLYGSLGEGLELIAPGPLLRQNLTRILEHHKAIYLQEYVETGGRDIRAFVVGDQVVAAMHRIAKPGEWITNIHQGASGEAVELSDETKKICVQAARVAGLYYTGVDIITSDRGPLILEVNGTPSWMGISAATGANIAEHLVDFIIQELKGRTKTQQ